MLLAPEPCEQLLFLAAVVLCVSRPETQTPPHWGRLVAGLTWAPLLEALLLRKGSGGADGWTALVPGSQDGIHAAGRVAGLISELAVSRSG